MKKIFVALLAIGMVAGFATSAFADPISPETGAGGSKSNSTPKDPSGADENLLDPAGAPVFLGGDVADDPSGHIGVGIGTDNEGVGRAALAGSSSGFKVYAEDYTPDNLIAGGVSAIDCGIEEAGGEPPLGCDGNDDDAVLITINPAG